MRTTSLRPAAALTLALLAPLPAPSPAKAADGCGVYGVRNAAGACGAGRFAQPPGAGAFGYRYNYGFRPGCPPGQALSPWGCRRVS